MRLSILIATMDSRRELFERLYNKIRGQVLTSGLHGQVEIISERDAGRMKIGHKRNILVNRAKGDYVCFVDDDDDVSSDYVTRVVEATKQGKDCVGITGRIMWHGNWVAFVHSLQYKEYARAKDGTFLRTPNHLNPIRRSIALKHPFTCKNYGEDTDYAMSMLRASALKTETFLDDPPMYWYAPAPGPKKG
jgi:glycosyltransferase involved in cell wall biosynthesis